MASEFASDLEHLRGFANAVMQDWPEFGGLDGGDVQDLAVKFGLLEAVEVTEPCGEDCNCAEYGDFPTACYRRTKVLTGADG